jgi:hypothetical protein
MARRKKINGICKICGYYGQLSYEHVPPEKAYNNRKHFYKVEYEKLLKDDIPYLKMSMEDIYTNGYATKKQGGIGFYSLCIRCNNNTGTWYGSAFVNWALQGMGILQKANGLPSLFYPAEFYPLRVIKQIITMFFSINSNSFNIYEPELVKFILNRDRKYLSRKYRIYCYYNVEGSLRYLGRSAIGELNNSKIYNVSEITFPPYGFVLTFDSEPPDVRLTEITHFANYSYDEIIYHYQRFATLPTYLPNVPGDYRSKNEIEIS